MTAFYLMIDYFTVKFDFCCLTSYLTFEQFLNSNFNLIVFHEILIFPN